MGARKTKALMVRKVIINILGKKIAMPGYATVRTLDAREEKRYVERRKDERSRRSYRIYLTDGSRGIAPELFSIVGKVNEQLLAVLSTTERQQLAGILNKLLLPIRSSRGLGRAINPETSNAYGR